MKISKKNKKRIVMLILFSLLLFYINFPYSFYLDLFKLKYKTPNPISYTFNVSIDELRDSIRKNEFKLKNADLEINTLKKEIYTIHMNSGESSTKSYEYRKLSKGRECYSIISFTFDSIAPNKTLIKYKEESYSRILSGKEPYFNLHELLRFRDVWIKKKPSNSDIYEILRFIGKIVGEKRMPPVNYPKCLSKKQILETFGPDNPFTEEEQFGKINRNKKIKPITSREENKNTGSGTILGGKIQ